MPRRLHPFPARMASDLAVAAIKDLPSQSMVLDPMCGSGTSLVAAAIEGHHSYGFDSDPLAVIISRAAVSNVRGVTLTRAGSDLVEAARSYSGPIRLPWIDDDPETRDFVDFWFAEPQKSQLRTIAALLAEERGPVSNLLRCSVSRLIITKDRGASLARDVSHSRPHKVRSENDYDVYDELDRSISHIAQYLETTPTSGRRRISHGDARRLPRRLSDSVDLVVTSPPYLNAIDYLRGHKFSLIWFGHRIRDLREIKRNSIGAERSPDSLMADISEVLGAAGDISRLPGRQKNMIRRYAQDCLLLSRELSRVMKPHGRAVLVVGNSNLRGVFVDNTSMIVAASEVNGLTVLSKQTRLLPPSSRYLPPPKESSSPLDLRMRDEAVIEFGVRSPIR